MAALMEIIIRAVDKASEVADKVQGKFSGMGDKVSKSIDKAARSTEKLSQAYQKMGTNGMSAYAQLTAKQQQHYQSMSKSRAMLEHLASSGTRMGNLINRGLTTADNAMSKISNKASQLRTKLENTTIGSKLVSGLESASAKVTSFTQKFDGVKAKIAEVGSKIGSAIGNGLDRAKSKVEALNQKLGTMGQVITSAVGAIGMGGIYDLTVGLGMAREQMLTLMTATTGSAGAARNLVNQLDQITNRSVVGLSELGNAMNNIKISTGMTTSQLSLIAPTVDKVGQAAILMGKDTTTAQEIMTAAFRGLNGEFDILRSNFGITKQTLMDAGWSGAADDVEGYNAALSKVLDENLDLSGVMDSTTGKIEKIKKAFRTAGKIIGEQVVPYIEKAADIFLRLTQQFPGLTTGIIAIATGFMLFLTVLPILSSVFGALKSMAVFLGIVKGAEDALTLSKMKSIAVDAATTAYTYAKAAALAVLGAATRVYNFIVAEGTIATKLATAAQWLWNAALAANPIGIVVVAIIALIAVLAYLYNSNETVRNAINWLWAGLQQLGGYIYGGLLAAWNALVGALSWVWDILVQVGSFIMGTFMSAWNAITSAMSPIISALGKLWGALQKVFGGWLNQKGAEANVILGAIAYVAGVVWGAFAKLVEIIGGYLKPHIDNLIIIFTILWDLLGGAFTAVWQTLSASIVGVIDFISNFIIILSDLVAGNITATEFMGLVWDEFAKLLTTLFLAMVNGVGKFTADLIRKAFEAGKGILDGFIQWLSQLPGRAWTLFMQFLGYLSQLPGMAYNRAARVGSSIVQAIRGYLTSLPGQMYNWGKQAIGRFTNAIIDSIPGLRGALDMVSSLFPKSPPKEGPLSEVTEDGMRSWMNSILDAGREVISEFSLDGMGLDLPTTAMSITTPVGVGDVDMPVMPAKDIFNTEEITRESSKVIEAANSTKTGAITAFNQMGDTISSSLKRLVGTDKESWRQIKSNTASQLSSMRTTTANATKNMTNAWNTMASQIVGSAQRIRSGSSGQIASLSLNIKTFYGKLINPTSWFAGPRPSRKGSSASFKAAGPGLTPERILDGFRFLESPCTDCYAGGWNYSAPNTKKINNTVNGYPVIMPDIRGLFVRDFLNTDNPLYGNLKLFEAVAERLIGPTSYDFYYNGRYSNLEALQRGAFNCWDGAEILMALGSAMGLPVSMARGKWGNIGHVAAIVGGKIFDTTQRQKRGVWRGSHGVSFGPAPPHFKPDGGTGDIRVEEDFNLNLTLDFRNVPDSVDEAYLRTILMDVINDSEVVRQLIRNRAFMSTLKGEMEKGRLRSRRTGG
jgi:hypothetical protein